MPDFNTFVLINFFSLENEEVVDLRLAIQDLENQIEEQKLKIENTTMSLLRVSGMHLVTLK